MGFNPRYRVAPPAAHDAVSRSDTGTVAEDAVISQETMLDMVPSSLRDAPFMRKFCCSPTVG